VGFDPKALGSRGGYLDGTKEELDLRQAVDRHRREVEATEHGRRRWWKRLLRRDRSGRG
jgi:hypothetical protein